jgi:aryl sulfotransferase
MTSWPLKQRELRNLMLDSTRWNNFSYRAGDVVVASWAKSGTTWVQQIIDQLLGRGSESTNAWDQTLWVENRGIPPSILAHCAARTGRRRLLKTHLPVDCLVFSPHAYYLYVGRDARDVVWSWYHHHMSLTPRAYAAINSNANCNDPPLAEPTADIRTYFHDWLDHDGWPLWPFWSHLRSWWEIRELPNVLFVHFNKLKEDMPREIRRIADFLDITVDPKIWPSIVKHCTFDYMRDNSSSLSAAVDSIFNGGAKAFVRRGTNGQWRDVLTSSDLSKYENIARVNLPSDCLRWLSTGLLPEPLPSSNKCS